MKPTALLCLASLLSTNFAFADDPEVKIVELEYIPHCTKLEIRNGIEWCIYSFDDFRDKLAPLDIDLQQCQELKENLDAQSAELVVQRRLLHEQLQVEVDLRALYRERSRDLNQKLIAKDKELQDERSKSRIGSPVAWTVAVISLSLLAGYVVADQL